MEAIKLCRLDTPIIFIEARINLSRFVVTGCAAKTSATVTFPSLNLISLFRSEERFSRNAETDLVCRLLLEKKIHVVVPSPACEGRQGVGVGQHLGHRHLGPDHRHAARRLHPLYSTATPTAVIYTLSLHDALPIYLSSQVAPPKRRLQ